MGATKEGKWESGLLLRAAYTCFLVLHKLDLRPIFLLLLGSYVPGLYHFRDPLLPLLSLSLSAWLSYCISFFCISFS